MTEPPIDVVHVGSASCDLTEDDPRGWRLGGGACYSALTTARLGLRTAAVVGVDTTSAAASELDLLRTAGVELHLVELGEGPVFHNRETPTGRIQSWPVHGRPLPIPELPPSWWTAKAWSLVPVASELNDEWATAVPDGAFISLAWQGLLRRRGPDQLTRHLEPVRSALLDRAQLVGVSRHDLADDVPLETVVGFLRRGARLALTDGHQGGRLIEVPADGRTRSLDWVAVPPEREVDPTGAGDVFLAALLATIIRPDLTTRSGYGRPIRDLVFAAATASFAVEAPGLQGVPDRVAVLGRLGQG